MIDFSNFEKINDEAYVWRNFLDDAICDDAFNESISLEGHEDMQIREIDRVHLLGGAMDERIVDKVNLLFKETGFITGSFLHWYTSNGVWFGMHRDDEAKDPTPFKKVWAGVIYLSNMDGGELLYPTYNNFVKPRKGDMVVHTAVLPHAAVPVTSGNKRTITYVIYDTSIPVDPEKEPFGEEVAAIKDQQVLACTDWLESDFGKLWRTDYNIDRWRNERPGEYAKSLT
jgi:hypothetical protein